MIVLSADTPAFHIEGILSIEPAKEGANLRRNRRTSSATTAGLPAPVSAKGLAMAAQQGIRLVEGEDVKAAGPDALEPAPEQALLTSDAMALAVSGGERCQLLTQHKQLLFGING